VQAAAQDEMAIQQRAAVAEELQDLRLGHGRRVEWQVASDKGRETGKRET
jgi:hypothetical protein